MSSQHHDDYDWTWEPAAGALLGIPLIALLALHTGRALALWVAGLGFHWPPTQALLPSIAGLLAGDVHAGLATQGAASIHLTWALAAALILVPIGLAGVVTIRHQQRRRFKGMATTGQAAQLLGAGRLRAQRHVIRPDLYPKR